MGMSPLGYVYLLVPVMDIVCFAALMTGDNAGTLWMSVQWTALAGGVMKTVGVVLYMFMGLNLYMPAIGIAQSIALGYLTFIAQAETENDNQKYYGYVTAGLGVALGGMKTAMMFMGGSDDMVADDYTDAVEEAPAETDDTGYGGYDYYYGY